MNHLKVLVSNNDVPKSAIELLQSKFTVEVNEETSRESLLKNIQGASAVLWASKMKVDQEMLDAAGPQLKIVGSMSAGLDHMDKELMKKRSIKLSNTPNVLNNAVADVAVLLALGASRRLREGRICLESAAWTGEGQYLLGQDISGSTVGIVGLGGIGQTIVRKLKPFNVKRFLYSGHSPKSDDVAQGAIFVSFDDLLKESDFVIVSCPLTSETKEMFNEGAFGKMKSSAVFVNVSRGSVVHQPSLVKALKEHAIFAAGLDVMTPEPLPADHELLKLPNCMLMPHLGSATLQTRADMAELAAKNIILALSDQPLLTPAL